MARTTINSLGVPAGTITAADLTFPLTNFSSTGIDDNASSTSLTIDSSGNISVTGTVDGRDLATDGTKLDNIEANATADQSDAEIKTAYENNSDTNAFTDALLSKLNNIEASADVTDTTNVTAAGALMDSELTDLAGVKGVTISTLQPKPSEGAFADGDKTKLDGIATGADVTPSWVPSSDPSYLTSFDITTQTDSKYLRSDTDDTTSGVLTTDQVRWGTGAGTYSGNPRSVVLGYSGGNYGQIGYGWVPTTTSGVHTSALSDIQTRIDLKDGIQVYSSNNTSVTSGTNVTWTELLDCRSSVLQYKNNNIWHAGNDGSGSGLDADTVDGVEASGLMQLGTSSTSTVTQVFSIAAGQPMLWRDTNATNGTDCNIYSYWYAQNTTLGYVGYGSSGDSHLYLNNSSVGSIYLGASSANGFLANGNVMWHAGNDGSGSGLDADLWDGNQFSSYLNQALLTTSSPTFNTVNYNQLYAYEGSNYIGSDPRWNNSGNNANEGCHHIYATTGSGGQWGQTGLALYNGGAYVFLTTKSGDSNFYHNNNKMWSAGNDGSGSGLDADTLDGVEGSNYLRSNVDDQMLGQLYGGFGAVTTGGTTDWNHSTNARSGGGYTLLLGTHSNGPGGGIYYHPFSFEYNNKDGTGNMTQFAIPYTGSNLYFRSRYSSSWSGWTTVWTSGNDGSGSGLDADTVDGYGTTQSGGAGLIAVFNASNGYLYTQNWIYLGTGDKGIYSGTNSAHFSPNATSSSSYGSWYMRGSKGSYGGYRCDYSGVNVGMYDSGGNGGAYRQGNGKWHFYYHVANTCMGINGSSTSSSYGLYTTGAIYATSNITAYSDRRVKENIIQIDSALDKVNKLEGVYYNRIDDETKTKEIGFIAQDVQEVVPELVTYAEDVDEYGVKYGNATALLVEAVKELTEQVNILKKELEELKNV